MERRESGGWKEEYLSEVSLVLKRTVNQKVVGRMRGLSRRLDWVGELSRRVELQSRSRRVDSTFRTG